MASRRDLIQAYQFAARRVVSAVVMRQTDPTEWPFRRLGGAGFGSIMVAIIALAAVGVYGMVVPGGKTSWKDGKSVVVEKETGASYAYVKGKLHPALNFASAALVVGSNQVASVSHASLVGVRRGVEVGIMGAPGSLPPTGKLIMPPWTFCTEQAPDKTGKLVSRTVLVAGRGPGRGDKPNDKALLVTDTKDDNEYLVWHDRRYLITDKNAVSVALRLDSEVNIPVGDAWLKALPKGKEIGPLKTSGEVGSASHVASGLKVGQVVQVEGTDNGQQYYLTDSDKLLPITQLQATIQEAKYGTAKQMSLSDAAAAAKGTAPGSGKEEPPATRPPFARPANSNTTLCAAYRNGSFSPQVLFNSTIPAGGGLPTEQTTSTDTPLADRVWVPPGAGALVQSLPSPSAQTGPLYLVTDSGIRYAIPNADALRALGYQDSNHFSKLPASLLVRMPEGPALDPDAARAALANEPDS